MYRGITYQQKHNHQPKESMTDARRDGWHRAKINLKETLCLLMTLGALLAAFSQFGCSTTSLPLNACAHPSVGGVRASVGVVRPSLWVYHDILDKNNTLGQSYFMLAPTPTLQDPPTPCRNSQKATQKPKRLSGSNF